MVGLLVDVSRTDPGFHMMSRFLKMSACRATWLRNVAVGVGGLVLLSGCQDGIDGAFPKAEHPIPKRLLISMKAADMTPQSPILVRIFKEDSLLEVWKQKSNGRYELLKDYEICKWSGKLGPKVKEGDRQAPEGFYSVNPWQMNPKSSYYLSFNMGYPNAYDRAHGRTGSHLMIHGACSSAGCYSMTDEFVGEIYALGREALRGGQKAFQIQAYPFRLTPENMVKHRNSPHYAYWKMLKRGYDQFEITRRPPSVDVCNKEYQFNVKATGGSKFSADARCPGLSMNRSLALSYLKVQQKDADAFEKLLAKEEDRDPNPVGPVTLEAVLPGVSVEEPVSAASSVPKETGPSDAEKPDDTSATALPGVEGAPRPKPQG
jgi:murein L,D-transpeptidase YafK